MIAVHGEAFGPYEIVGLIGRGGMGEVYRARDTRLGREVALKFLAGPLASDPDRLARFTREARLLAALNHPNIAALHHLVESGDRSALVLELVEGRTLAERLARGPLELDEALGIAGQIVDAVAAAHDSGIVHRDLKPANIKIRPDGTVKVLDFGIAKAIVDAQPDQVDGSTVTADETRRGTVLGTAGYMSPEQVRGTSVDRQTDIWAFGCVLFEILTGRAAFVRSTSAETMAAVLEREPDWNRLPAATPAAIVRLLRRCLAKDRRRRLRDIADARLELEAAAEGGADEASGGVAVDRRGRPTKAVVIAGALALASVATALWALSRARTDALGPIAVTRHAVAMQLTNHGGVEYAPALAPDGRSFAFVSDHGGTPDIWVRQVSGGEPVRLTNDEEEESELAYSPDGDSIYFTRMAPGERSVWRIGALGGAPQRVVADAIMPAPAPDGRRLAHVAVVEGGLDLILRSLDGGGVRTLVRGVRVPAGGVPRWSPDGRWLSYLQGGFLQPHNLFLVDPESGEQRQVTRFAGEEGTTSHAWLPDSRYVAVSFIPPEVTSERDLGIVDVETGTLTRLTYNVAQAFGSVSVAADGSRLLATNVRMQHSIWKVPLGFDPDENGRRAEQFLDERHDALHGFVSRDGATLLFNGSSTGGRNLWLVPIDGSAPARQITAIPGNAVGHSALSPDGTRVVFSSDAGGSSDLWIQNVDGSNLRQLTNDSAPDSWPIWSPDGRTIAFNSVREGRAGGFRMPADGGTPERFAERPFRGDWIANPSGGGTLIVNWAGVGVRLMNGETGAIIWERAIGSGASVMPMFSPDGRSISISDPESRGRHVVRILDTATGTDRLAVRFPEPFVAEFRVSFVDGGRAVLVHRHEEPSHITLLDRFWVVPAVSAAGRP